MDEISDVLHEIERLVHGLFGEDPMRKRRLRCPKGFFYDNGIFVHHFRIYIKHY